MEPARKLEELVVWQLASELSDRCDALARAPKAASNRQFCEQIREASDSVPANLAEGFGRYLPKENASFVRIAKGSLVETRNWLMKGKRLNYWPVTDYEAAWRLSSRTLKATLSYLRYLESCEGQLPESIEAPRRKRPSSEGTHRAARNREPEEPRT